MEVQQHMNIQSQRIHLQCYYSGYTFFEGADEEDSWTMIPLLAGAKVYLSPKMDWYFAGLIGVNFVTLKITQMYWLPNTASSTEFAGN